ncbi:MAG: LysR substrate-binding domain-containing protein, partial [Roseococcus sp.]
IRSRVQVAGSETIARMVEAGHGVSILPASFARPRVASGIVARPLREAWASRHLRLCFQPPESMTKPARLLVDHLASRDRTVDL